MKYRAYIEDNFLIDKANSGQLVPFKFNDVQAQYYSDLCKEYDIENKGITQPMRENILKARREGFSSLILALFAADDLTQDNPTETDVLSYKDDATNVFRKRYRTFILSAMALDAGYTHADIMQNINVLEDIAKECLSIDADEIELKHNKAHFQCNTASARVGGRGGVRHKILFSEIAFYPDTEKMLASEMIEATMRQVDPSAGWIFAESTENGTGTYQHKLWVEAKRGRSRFRNRFYGAKEFYTAEQIATIKSEYIDMDSFRRDYPMSEDDLFKGSAKSFTTEKDLVALTEVKGASKEIMYFSEMHGKNGVDLAEILLSEIRRLEKMYPDNALYFAIDEGKDVDANVMTGLKDNRRDLRGCTKGIEIDTTRGDWLADWFERNTSYYIKRTKFSRPFKSLTYSNLLVVIEDKATKLPVCKVDKEWVSDEHKHFWEQMINLEKETIGDLLVVAHPKGNCNRSDHNYDECVHHDDYPDAWMMVEDLYAEINGAPVRKVQPKVQTVENAVDKLLSRGMRGGNRGSGSHESFE